MINIYSKNYVFGILLFDNWSLFDICFLNIVNLFKLYD